MRKNTKGISYVELVIVMGILAALLSISSISFSAAWRARASKAANSVDALLSQSKVNALSGDDNYMQIVFRGKDNAKGYSESGYYAELFKEGSSSPYKSELIGNSRLQIRFGDDDIAQNKAIRIKFHEKTGAVVYAGAVNASAPEAPTSASDITKIYFHFGNTYCVSLWKITGEHNIT